MPYKPKNKTVSERHISSVHQLLQPLTYESWNVLFYLHMHNLSQTANLRLFQVGAHHDIQACHWAHAHTCQNIGGLSNKQSNQGWYANIYA